jgi:hypothetical protein
MTIGSIKTELTAIDATVESIATTSPSTCDVDALAFAVHQLVVCVGSLVDEVAQLSKG